MLCFNPYQKEYPYEKDGSYFDHQQQLYLIYRCHAKKCSFDNRRQKLQQYMQEKEVLDLIQKAIAPLRQRIARLQSENQKLNAQVSRVSNSLHGFQIRGRQRSSSKDGNGVLKKDENREIRSPSVKKGEESNSRPSWNIGKVKPDAVYIKSPSKNVPPSPIPKPPAGKPTPRDKAESEKNIETGKKIMGGKKMEENGQSIKTGLISPESEDNRQP